MAQKGGRRTYRKGGSSCHTKKHKGGAHCHTKKHKGGKRRTRRTRRVRRGGGGLFSAAKTALLPFALFKAQKHMQKKRRSSRRTRRR